MTAMLIGLTALSDTKKSEGKPKTTSKPVVETIKRRHSFNSMMKFFNSRKNLFTISESSEDAAIISSSFTAGASTTKPPQRKTRTGKKKSVVQKSLATALSIVAQRSSRGITKSNNYNGLDNNNNSNHTSVAGTEALNDASTVSTLTVSVESSSQNSINTCSTASLTSADDDDSVYAKRQAKEQASKTGRTRKSSKKRAGSKLLLPKEPPLIQGEMRWGETSNYRTLGEEDYHYAGMHSSRRQMTRDVAPVMPVRSRD